MGEERTDIGLGNGDAVAVRPAQISIIQGQAELVVFAEDVAVNSVKEGYRSVIGMLGPDGKVVLDLIKFLDVERSLLFLVDNQAFVRVGDGLTLVSAVASHGERPEGVPVLAVDGIPLLEPGRQPEVGEGRVNRNLVVSDLVHIIPGFLDPG